MCKYVFVLSFSIFVGVAQRLRPLQEQTLRFNEESNHPTSDGDELNSLARFLFGLSRIGLRSVPRSSRLSSSYRLHRSFSSANSQSKMMVPNRYAYSNQGHARFVYRFGKAVMRAEQANVKKMRATLEAKRTAASQTKDQDTKIAEPESSTENVVASPETTIPKLSDAPVTRSSVHYSDSVVDDQPIVPIGKAASTRSTSSPKNEPTLPKLARPISRSSVFYSDSVVDDRPIVPIGKATSARAETPSNDVASRDLPTSRSSVYYSDSVVDDRPLVPIPAMPGKGTSVGLQPSGNGLTSRSSGLYSESPSIVPAPTAPTTLENVASSLSDSDGEDIQESNAETRSKSYSSVRPMARNSFHYSKSDVIDDRPLVPIGKGTSSSHNNGNIGSRDLPTSRSSVHYSDSVVDDRPVVPLGKATSARPDSSSNKVVSRDLPTSRSSVYYSDSVVDDRPVVPLGKATPARPDSSSNEVVSRDLPTSRSSVHNADSVVDDRPVVPLGKATSTRPDSSSNRVVSRDLPTSRSSVYYSDSVVDDRPVVPLGKATSVRPESSSNKIASRDLPTSRSSVHYYDSVIDDRPVVPLGKATSKKSVSSPTDEEEV